MTRPETWLHVFATFGRGGPQLRAVQLMARVPAVRHLVVAMDGCTDAAAAVPFGALVELRSPPPRAGFLANARQMADLIRAVQPDLLLTYNWGAIETVLAARRLGFGALVHHEDGFLPEEVKRRFLRRDLARRWLFRRAAAVVVPSAVLHDIARRTWSVPGERLHHLPNGVDLARFSPPSVPPPGPPGEPLVVGTAGGLRGEKDHGTLLRAFAALRVPVRLRVAGDGPLRSELRRLTDDLVLGDRVKWLGALADTADFYRGLHAFVLSSITEQMPLSLLEAMASGLPVVATDVGDVRAVLPEECRAGLVAPRDPAALAAALESLLGDGERRQQEGRLNRARVERSFSLSACLERYLSVYQAAMRK